MNTDVISMETIWGQLNLDYVHQIIAKQTAALLKSYPLDIAAALGLINETQFDELALRSDIGTLPEFLNALPYLQESQNDFLLIAKGIFRIQGVYQYPTLSGIEQNDDIIEYLHQNQLLPVDFLTNPTICATSIAAIEQLSRDFDENIIDNPLVLWFKSRNLTPLLAFTSKQEIQARLDMLVEHQSKRDYSTNVFSFNSLPESFDAWSSLFSHLESKLIHTLAVTVDAGEVTCIKLFTENGPELWDLNPDDYQALRTLFQLVNVGVKTLQTEHVSRKLVFEMPESDHVDFESEIAITINSTPTGRGIQISINLQYSAEIEREPLWKSRKAITTPGLYLSVSPNVEVMKKNAYAALCERYHTHDQELHAIALDETFSLWIPGICHIKLTDAKDKLQHYIDCGYHTLIVGQVKTAEVAAIATRAAVLGMIVIGSVNAADFGAAKQRLMQFCQLSDFSICSNLFDTLAHPIIALESSEM